MKIAMDKQAGVTLKPKHELIHCPRCGAEFECKLGSILLCHCSDISLSTQQREYISRHWDRCLCHCCLLDIIRSGIDPADE